MLDILEKEMIKKKSNPVSLIVFSFLAIILLGSILLYLPISNNSKISYIDALFIATSATDVTGLAVVDLNNQFTAFGKIVILLLIQIGGLGYMAIATFVFLVIGRRITLKHRLFLGESMNRPSLEHIIVFAKYIFGYVIMFELFGAILLFLAFRAKMDIANALKHSVFLSISAFNNAGFDLLGDFRGLTIFQNEPFILIVISLLIIFGGIGFIVLAEGMDLLTKMRNRMSLHSKIAIITTLFLILSGALFIFLSEANNPETIGSLSLSNKILQSYFHSVTSRTAGFSSFNIGAMTKAGLLFLMALMFIGASPGSTGGGIKTTTFAVLAANTASAIADKDHAEILGRRLPWQIVTKSIAIFSLSILLVLFVSLQISMLEPYPLQNIMFEVISAFGTVGLTTGITPMLGNATKALLIATMFIGRIGPLTLAVFFASKRATNKITLPEEEVSVG